MSQGIQSVLSTETSTGVLAHRMEAGIRFHNDSIKRLHTESGYLMAGGVLVPDGGKVLTQDDNTATSHALAV